MKKTDWDHYYKKPYKLNSYLKKTVTRKLVKYISAHSSQTRGFTITEFGGGNSCFYEPFDAVFKPSKYFIVDNNQVGLDELKQRTGERENLELICHDIFEPLLSIKSHIVFSVGLIEHFPPEETRKAIQAHLDIVEEKGIVILGFPTPTLLYRIARKISEMCRTWIFHDERPLEIPEVLETLKPDFDILETGIIYSIIFTQAFVVARKK